MHQIIKNSHTYTTMVFVGWMFPIWKLFGEKKFSLRIENRKY